MWELTTVRVDLVQPKRNKRISRSAAARRNELMPRQSLKPRHLRRWAQSSQLPPTAKKNWAAVERIFESHLQESFPQNIGTWEDIEETYMLSDKMIEFTGDLSTPQVRAHYCTLVEKLSNNDNDAWTVTITVKKKWN
ncbi:hypothetical protein DPMN_077526 [Dreissena polymorpha]|uniref:Uncharacterized protein n=1 Tax=Dreissena polymorpha TaxID=45954 RepID=A0A9D3YNZ7_DREPO|nr:hypothetical protein DPMN_077526 [Dreissena polymorpha]